MPIPIEIHLSNGGAGEYSKLWGESGELWDPKSRLPDFSYAGYHMGEDPIPDVPVKLNVRDFGAKGDGTTDDSEAFLQAIEAIDGGAIYIPPGRYKITRVLKINKSNVVLRGAGVDATVLYFPQHLGEVLGPGDAPSGTPYYSWRDGFIRFEGVSDASNIANVVGQASRGDYSLELSSTSGVRPGQMVWLFQTDPGDGSYLGHLHADQLEGGDVDTTDLARFASRIKDVQGTTIVLERPLRTDVRRDWQPSIREFKPGVREVGIEDLTVEFPEVTASEHHEEPGYNGIQVEYASDCWVRNLRFLNADNGIFLDFTHFCTIEDVYFGAYQGRGIDAGKSGVVSGHHAMQTRRSEDNLFTGFEVDTLFRHDITLDAGSNGNVFSNGKGINLNFDHHRKAPFEKLFTDIDVGNGDRLWMSGGNSSIGSPHSGARETFWYIRAQTPLDWPAHRWTSHVGPWGPEQMNLVGVTTNAEAILTPDGKWFEVIDPDKLFPPDLHLAQLARRLRGGIGR